MRQRMGGINVKVDIANALRPVTVELHGPSGDPRGSRLAVEEHWSPRLVQAAAAGKPSST